MKWLRFVYVARTLGEDRPVRYRHYSRSARLQRQRQNRQIDRYGGAILNGVGSAVVGWLVGRVAKRGAEGGCNGQTRSKKLHYTSCLAYERPILVSKDIQVGCSHRDW